MRLTTADLSQALHRHVTDVFGFLDGYTEIEFDSITLDEEFYPKDCNYLYTLLLAVVSKDCFKTLHRGDIIRITLIHNDVLDIEKKTMIDDICVWKRLLK